MTRKMVGEILIEMGAIEEQAVRCSGERALRRDLSEHRSAVRVEAQVRGIHARQIEPLRQVIECVASQIERRELRQDLVDRNEPDRVRRECSC